MSEKHLAKALRRLTAKKLTWKRPINNRQKGWIKEAIEAWQENMVEERSLSPKFDGLFTSKKDANDTLSNHIGNEFFGKKVKDEFFDGDKNFRQEFEEQFYAAFKKGAKAAAKDLLEEGLDILGEQTKKQAGHEAEEAALQAWLDKLNPEDIKDWAEANVSKIEYAAKFARTYNRDTINKLKGEEEVLKYLLKLNIIGDYYGWE